jgi:hypothetical protein
MSCPPLAQQKRHFAMEKLPDFSTLHGSHLEEALHDNTLSPVADQVTFRLDFPAWLARLTERDHAIVENLMVGERTLDVAGKYGLSPARISQKRREFCNDWQNFCGEDISTSRPHSSRCGLSQEEP